MISKFHYKKISLILVFLIILSASNIYSGIHIRINQVGFLPDDAKTGVILSDHDLYKQDYSIVNIKTNKEAFKGKLFPGVSRFGNFRYTYKFEFSKLKEAGTYVFVINKKKILPV